MGFSSRSINPWEINPLELMFLVIIEISLSIVKQNFRLVKLYWVGLMLIFCQMYWIYIFFMLIFCHIDIEFLLFRCLTYDVISILSLLFFNFKMKINKVRWNACLFFFNLFLAIYPYKAFSALMLIPQFHYYFNLHKKCL